MLVLLGGRGIFEKDGKGEEERVSSVVMTWNKVLRCRDIERMM